MQFKKKPVVIEAITFAELVAHGIEVCKAEGREGNIINGMPYSFDYKGHAITHENDERYLIPTLEGTHNMTPADMLITGVKGEIYPCKLDIFAATYDPVVEATDGFVNGCFGDAIAHLKSGGRVARAGWNGKGMWLSLSCDGTREVPAENFWSPHNAEFAREHGGKATVLPSVTMKTATDEILMGWLASQSDMLATDWQSV